MTQGSFPSKRPVTTPKKTFLKAKFAASFSESNLCGANERPLPEEKEETNKPKKGQSGKTYRNRKRKAQPDSTRRQTVSRTETTGKTNTKGLHSLHGFIVRDNRRTDVSEETANPKSGTLKKLPPFIGKSRSIRKRERNFRSKARSSAGQDEKEKAEKCKKRLKIRTFRNQRTETINAMKKQGRIARYAPYPVLPELYQKRRFYEYC